MLDWLITLGAIGLCAVLSALVEAHEPPAAAPPRRNCDVLAPPPRSQATRVTGDTVTEVGIWGAEAVARDVRLTLRIFGPRDDTILVIRPEVRDGRQ